MNPYDDQNMLGELVQPAAEATYQIYVHTKEKITEADVLAIDRSKNHHFHLDPDNDRIDSILPIVTAQCGKASDLAFAGVVYSTRKPTFSDPIFEGNIGDSPSATQIGVQSAMNRSNQVFYAFDQLGIGPVATDTKPDWRNQTDATLTLRKVSPLIWRSTREGLGAIARHAGFDQMYRDEYQATCTYTVIPALLYLFYRNNNVFDANWITNPGGNLAAFLHRDPNSYDYKCQAAEINELRSLGNKSDAQWEDLLLDMYFDQRMQHVMLSMTRCPVGHYCKTLERF